MYIQKRKGRVYVYYYDKRKGRPVQLPRAETMPLDKLSEDEIEVWLAAYAASHGLERERAKRRTQRSDDELTALFARYQRERKEEGVGDRQLQNERAHFAYISNYFIGQHEAKDVRQWKGLGGGLKMWLVEHTKLGLKTRREIVQTVNRFGEWLRENGLVEDVWAFRTPRGGEASKTPLVSEMSPSDVLKAVKGVEGPLWKIMVLVGYFASLRPEESFALCREHFLTGQAAVDESQTYARLKREKLGSKLAVIVEQALVDGKELGPPKNQNSNGVVTVWHPEAARQLATLLRDMPDGRLVGYDKSYLFRLYNKKARQHMSGLTLHDLRRASALYLGRTKGLSPFLLQDCLRHADLATTQLYTRRPKGELVRIGSGQDFDDVV